MNGRRIILYCHNDHPQYALLYDEDEFSDNTAYHLALGDWKENRRANGDSEDGCVVCKSPIASWRYTIRQLGKMTETKFSAEHKELLKLCHASETYKVTQKRNVN